MFDIVIPVGPNDINIVINQIRYTKKNIVGYRKIFLISYHPYLKIDGCITIPEQIFPFKMIDIERKHGKSKRNGWYLQQLLKLYVSIVIPNLLDSYLVIDSDTFFLKPIKFKEGITEKDLFNYSNEYHQPYFIHMNKLHPSFIKVIQNVSGICHHMLFNREYIKELIDMVEVYHNKSKPFWKIFLENVDINLRKEGGSGASEYEIYFNFMLIYHSDKIKIRELKWKNTNKLEDLYNNYDYISYHWYLR